MVSSYLVRGCWDQDGIFQLGEWLLNVEQHAGLKQTCRSVVRDLMCTIKYGTIQYGILFDLTE